MSTIRQQIIELLQSGTRDARELSQALSIRERQVYEHLPHIERTVAAQGKTLHISPPRCASCGFEFNDRTRLTRPSRCPRCREERIDSPKFTIR